MKKKGGKKKRNVNPIKLKVTVCGWFRKKGTMQ